MAITTTTPSGADATYKAEIGVIARDESSIFYPSDEGAIGDSGTTDNLTVIQDTIDAAAAAGGGNVHLSMDSAGGDYHTSAGVIVEPNVRLTMDPGVVLTYTGAAATTTLYALLVKPGAQLHHAHIKCNNNTYTGSLIKLDGGSAQDGPFDRQHQTSIHNVKLEGTAHPTNTTVGVCRGVHMWAGGDGEYVEWCQFSNITFRMLGQAVRMESSGGTGGSPCFVNGNQFVNLQFDACLYGVLMVSADNNNQVSGNLFVNLQFEPSADTFSALTIQGDVNTFTNVHLWDWSLANGSYAVTFVNGLAENNYVDVTGLGADGLEDVSGNLIANTWSINGRVMGGQRQYTVSTLTTVIPPSKYLGAAAFATDGRKAGEGVGSGTGVLCFSDGTNWIAVDSGATVAA